MKKQSQTVQRDINHFYAKLATAAAKKAVAKVEENNLPDAKKWASQVEEWLGIAGAEATRWCFRLPNV